jgi:hypothetical protein
MGVANYLTALNVLHHGFGHLASVFLNLPPMSMSPRDTRCHLMKKNCVMLFNLSKKRAKLCLANDGGHFKGELWYLTSHNELIKVPHFAFMSPR